MTERSVRVFAPMTVADLQALWTDGVRSVSRVAALSYRPDASSDDIDERADLALRTAARHATTPIVITVADLDPASVGQPDASGLIALHNDISLQAVAAVFVGEPSSADLLWYASQEIPAICESLRSRGEPPR